MYPALVLIPLGLWGVVVWFFRDPEREVPREEGVVLSPADGKVRDIETVREEHFIKDECLRIGIFMSVFDVHINRSPCGGTVSFLEHYNGVYRHAGTPEAIERNESVRMGISTEKGRILVRQVAGVLARRIVNTRAVGEWLVAGERIGMIKLGSRVEVYVPRSIGFECTVKVGDSVKAGLTVLGRIRDEEG